MMITCIRIYYKKDLSQDSELLRLYTACKLQNMVKYDDDNKFCTFIVDGIKYYIDLNTKNKEKLRIVSFGGDTDYIETSPSLNCLDVTDEDQFN